MSPWRSRSTRRASTAARRASTGAPRAGRRRFALVFLYACSSFCLIHQSSSSPSSFPRWWRSQYLVFHEKVKTTRIYVRDCSTARHGHPAPCRLLRWHPATPHGAPPHAARSAHCSPLRSLLSAAVEPYVLELTGASALLVCRPFVFPPAAGVPVRSDPVRRRLERGAAAAGAPPEGELSGRARGPGGGDAVRGRVDKVPDTPPDGGAADGGPPGAGQGPEAEDRTAGR